MANLYVWFRGTLIFSVTVIFILAIQSGIHQFNASNQTPSQAPSLRGPFPKVIAFPVSIEKLSLSNRVEPVKPVPMAFDEVMRLIGASAERHNVPSAFVRSIVAAESNFKSDVVSLKGAVGLMQLMPATAKMLGANPNIPAQNVDAGTHYLRILMDRYQRHSNWLPRVIAAYNAGPGMVDKYQGVPPFRETRVYVGRVMTFIHRFVGPSESYDRIATFQPDIVCKLNSMARPKAFRRRGGRLARLYSESRLLSVPEPAE